MIGELIVFAVIIATMGYLYLKGSILKSFIFFVCSLLAAVVALSFFETAAPMVIGYGYGGQWVFAALLILIFAIVLIVLLAISEKLEPLDLYFGDLPDRIGRCVLAVPSGLIIAGIIIIALNLSPLPGKWFYQRFAADNKNIRPDQPDRTLILNADGFTASLVSVISKGSLAGKKSLAVFHPQLLNELGLNRVSKERSNAIMAGANAISVSKAYWATDHLADAIKNKTPGTKPVVVIAEIRNGDVKDGGAMYDVESGMVTFTLAQLRLMCADAPDSFRGRGEVVFPAGYFDENGKFIEKGLTEEISLAANDFPGGSKTLNLVFNVPTNKTPIMLQFKLNAAAEIPRVRKSNETEEPAEPVNG